MVVDLAVNLSTCISEATRESPGLDGGFKIVDSNGQTLAYVYDHADPRDAEIAKALTLDEARRIAANIAKLPSLLRRAENAAD